jgi:uncharacterized coiled-coil protein SlyX
MSTDRLDRLESQFAHQEEFMYQLNKIVVEQQDRIERLEKELLTLRQSVETEGVGTGATGSERPPHY